jgi:hypothetical protein
VSTQETKSFGKGTKLTPNGTQQIARNSFRRGTDNFTTITLLDSRGKEAKRLNREKHVLSGRRTK